MDYDIAVETPGYNASSEGSMALGACPVCGSINTISEGLYYFKEEAFDSTLTWLTPYKQFQKIYCSKCGVGRLIDYDKIKNIYELNKSIRRSQTVGISPWGKIIYTPDKRDTIHFLSGTNIPEEPRYTNLAIEITYVNSLDTIETVISNPDSLRWIRLRPVASPDLREAYNEN